MRNYLTKAISDPDTRNHVLLCLLISLLTLTPVLGLGFKNTILSSSFILAYIIYINPKFNYLNTKTNKAMLAFLIFFSLSMFFRQTPYGFHEFINLGLGALLVINLAKYKIQTQKLSKFLITLTSIISVFSVITLYFTGADRAFGTFFGADPYTYYPNAFSNLLLIAIVLASSNFLKSKFIKNNKVLLLMIFFSLTGFWATFSRGAYLSLAISMLVLILINLFQDKFKWKLWLKKCFILLSIATCSLLTTVVISSISDYGSSFTDRVQTTDISSVKSATERPILWQGAIDIFKENPIWGSGSGSFQFIYPQYQTKLLSNAPHPHNLFLKLLSENGIIVFTIFSIIILFALRPSRFIESPGYATAFLGINLQFLLDYNMNFPIICFLYFFLISNLLFSDHLPKNKSNSLNIFGFIFTALFIVTLITQTFGYYYIKKIEDNPMESPSYYIELAKIAPFKHQLFSQLDKPIPTDKYPNFHPYIYVQALNNSDITIQNNLIQKALQLNYFNDLAYHLFQAEILVKLNDQISLQELDQKYFDLVANYIELLSVNTHNTITSKNPQNTYKIIQIFKANNSPNDWLSLETKLNSVYKTEKNKFQTRFHYNLPELDE